jgi:hypothetical protein
MRIGRITVSAVVYSTEDFNKVGKAISALFPFEFKMNARNVKGHYGNPMKYLETEISNKSEIKKFWSHFISLLGNKEILKNTLEERLDEQNVLHIRIDKQKAYLGRIELAEKGDAIVLRAKIVTYPSKREIVLKAAKELIEHGC